MLDYEHIGEEVTEFFVFDLTAGKRYAIHGPFGSRAGAERFIQQCVWPEGHDIRVGWLTTPPYYLFPKPRSK
jgi:hypothetical protein